MRILAVYGSNYGQAEAVVRRIIAILEAHGDTVSLFKGDAIPTDLSLSDFGAIVVAASIRMGRYEPYMHDFVQSHHDTLNARPTAFVSVNGTRPESAPEWRAEAEGYVEEFLKQTGWEPLTTASFAGALRYPRYDLLTRWIMKGISRRRGGPTDTSREYEFTDWDAVDQFGEDLARDLSTL